jgi:hypothetical protein
MVWAAVAYDRDGEPIGISGLSAWVRTRDGIRLRDQKQTSPVTALPVPQTMSVSAGWAS